MRAGVDVADVMNIVRRDDLEIKLLGQLEQARNDLLLLRYSVILDFDEIIFPAENLHEPAAGLPRFFVAIVEQMLRHERREAARETNQAVGVLRKRFDIRARLVVETAEVRVGDELQQVLVTREIFREQPEMEDRLPFVGAT